MDRNDRDLPGGPVLDPLQLQEQLKGLPVALTLRSHEDSFRTELRLSAR